jgi:hypothetical protein
MDVGYIGGVTALIEWGSTGKKRKCVSNAAKMPDGVYKCRELEKKFQFRLNVRSRLGNVMRHHSVAKDPCRQCTDDQALSHILTSQENVVMLVLFRLFLGVTFTFL